MPVDLEAVLARLKAGDATIGTLDAEISSYASEYPQEVPDDYEELNAWIEKRRNLATALNKVGGTLRKEKESEGALGVGRLLIAGARLLGVAMEMRANAYLGEQLAVLGAYKNAVGYFDRADILFDKLNSTDAKYPLGNITLKPHCLRQLERYDDLETHALRLIKVLGEAAPFFEHLGISYAGRGRNEDAIQAFNRALTLLNGLESTDSKTDETRAELYSQIGNTERSRGHYEEALIAFEAARAFALKARNPKAAAFALSEQGITWDMIGELTRAHQILERAAREADDLGAASDAARWRGSLPLQEPSTDGLEPANLLTGAGAYLRQVPANTKEARRLALAAIKKSLEGSNWRTEAEARNILAQTYSLEGREAQGLSPARRAVELAVKLGDKTLEMTYRTNLGIRLRNYAKISEAEQELRTAIAIGRELRNSARTTEFRQAINGRLSSAYDELSVVLAREWKGKDGQDLPRRNAALVELAQEARAVNFARWLAAEQAIEKLDDLHAPLLDLRATEVRLEMSALSQNSEITPLVTAQQNARQEFTRATQKHGLNFDFAVPIYSPPELQRVIKAEQCVLDLYADTGQVFATVIKSDGEPETSAIRWPRRERVEFMRRWQQRIFGNSKAEWRASRFYGLRDEGAATSSSATNADGPTVAELLAELDEKLIRPLTTLLEGCQRVTIVPHRELSLVPYWMVAEHAPHMSVSLVPGTNIFKLLHDRSRKTMGNRLALGDVTGTLKYVPIELSSLPQYSTLPYRVDDIVNEARNATLMHVAGHGQFNEGNPYLAGLVVEARHSSATKQSLRPFGALSKFGEEMLTVAEVLAHVQLNRCFLAVLSACCSGLPRQHPASEFVGLPAAFLIAGANNVIASLWPVDDGATCIMMQEFYAALSLNGTEAAPVSAALCEARERVRGISRAEVVKRLGSGKHVPAADPPYDGPRYSLAFQHYGVN
jgi:CHAT domain-containing protein